MAVFLVRLVDRVVVHDLDRDGVIVRMSLDGVIFTIRVDRVRRNARLAGIQTVLEQELIRLLGKINLAHVDLPCPVKDAFALPPE